MIPSLRDKLKSKKLWAFAVTLSAINGLVATAGLGAFLAALFDLIALGLYLTAETMTDIFRTNSRQ